MKKLSKLTKLLLPSVSFLLVAIMSLTGATYAWFNNSNSASIADVDVGVVKATGLRISWDKATWGSDLSMYDDNYLKDAQGTYRDNTNMENFRFSPLSTAATAYNKDTGFLEMFSAEVRDNVITKIAKDASGHTDGTSAISRGYIKYDLYFDITEDNTTVEVSSIKIDTKSHETTGTANNIGVASRVAFINHGTEEKATSLSGGNFFIYEPMPMIHTAEGLQTYKDIYGTAATSDNAVLKYSAIVKEGTIGTEGLKMNDTATGYLESVTTTQFNASTSKTGVSFNMNKGINRVTVYVWVEGQDADCTNYLGGSQFNLAINFNKVEPEAE